ncbi:hypothetical protein [Prochlorococcus sp. MIT 1300]|uniref:hypothetical protein n=1 Tax=Prochlorococcus sp. MIT 1300 TaxID=3096218 RepID=UPI002A7623F2|nr:hypothetical protein [Prochlorococcus sp. MIT 1300]
MTDKQESSSSTLDLLRSLSSLLLSLSSAASLLVIAISILPLSQWAKHQNECVESQKGNVGVAYEVSYCNGRVPGP